MFHTLPDPERPDPELSASRRTPGHPRLQRAPGAHETARAPAAEEDAGVNDMKDRTATPGGDRLEDATAPPICRRLFAIDQAADAADVPVQQIWHWIESASSRRTTSVVGDSGSTSAISSPT